MDADKFIYIFDGIWFNKDTGTRERVGYVGHWTISSDDKYIFDGIIKIFDTKTYKGKWIGDVTNDESVYVYNGDWVIQDDTMIDPSYIKRFDDTFRKKKQN